MLYCLCCVEKLRYQDVKKSEHPAVNWFQKSWEHLIVSIGQIMSNQPMSPYEEFVSHHFTSYTTQGSLNYLFGGIKQCKCLVILRDFLYNSALFGLVILWPLQQQRFPMMVWNICSTSEPFWNTLQCEVFTLILTMCPCERCLGSDRRNFGQWVGYENLGQATYWCHSPYIQTSPYQPNPTWAFTSVGMGAMSIPLCRRSF